MEAVLRSSEFWMGLVTALGQAGVMFKFWSQEDYNLVLLPALTYIVGRVFSKVVKSVGTQ